MPLPERLPDLAEDARRVAQVALAEDGSRDLTTEVVSSSAETVQGRLECRGRAVLAGLAYADAVGRLAGVSLTWSAREGQRIEGDVIGEVSGGLGAVLRAERPLLNLLQRASGIATATRAYVDALAGTTCRLLHTRKTAAGLRLFDVAAVVAGGGEVHRLDLARTVMIKDNHWRALERSGRSLADALEDARRRGALACLVEVESEPMVRAACSAGADRLLIDNQTPDTVRAWARLARSLAPRTEIEASGGVTLATARAYADAGADYVSVGAITNSVDSADIALELF
ncbi:MAG: carboxylating nicotinate-nucleotide diphosphorylase [Gemmatimonadales bacterium]